MKQRMKTGVDIAMTVLFLGQMGYHMMDNRMHEWTGVTLCVLFLLHHALNPGWHRGLFEGRYSASRVFLTGVDALLTLAMIAVIVSAILVSRHVFDFLGLRMRAVGRRIHMPATMWAFLLTGLHIGLHWHIVLGKLDKPGNAPSSGWPGWCWQPRLPLACGNLPRGACGWNCSCSGSSPSWNMANRWWYFSPPTRPCCAYGPHCPTTWAKPSEKHEI